MSVQVAVSRMCVVVAGARDGSSLEVLVAVSSLKIVPRTTAPNAVLVEKGVRQAQVEKRHSRFEAFALPMVGHSTQPTW